VPESAAGPSSGQRLGHEEPDSVRADEAVLSTGEQSAVVRVLLALIRGATRDYGVVRRAAGVPALFHSDSRIRVQQRRQRVPRARCAPRTSHSPRLRSRIAGLRRRQMQVDQAPSGSAGGVSMTMRCDARSRARLGGRAETPGIALSGVLVSFEHVVSVRKRLGVVVESVCLYRAVMGRAAAQSSHFFWWTDDL
jgi:hypothetical protein